PFIPVIAVTDDTESKGVAEAFRTGLQDCLPRDGLTRKVLIRAIKRSAARKYFETRFQKREEALFHSKKMDAVGRLANGISHDFNNLLSVISGYTDMAIVRAGDDRKQLKYLNAVADAARKASLLTKRLLLFGRKRESSPSVIDLDKSLSEMEQMIQRLISEDMDLSFEKDSGKKMILMDNSQLEQVVVNLVINARDSIQDARGRVIIKTELRRDRRNKSVVLLSITDNGVGIPDEALDKIFEPFYSTKEGERGAGMGLFVIYSIIKSNNGEIQVESEPGMGTAFRITFPYTENA
ncbi:MAG: sensor histidine kinase, partial [Chitinivibrionales bacterium]